MSLESREKMRKAKIGFIPWNKGKHASFETRKKLSIAHKGQSPTYSFPYGHTPWNKGQMGMKSWMDLTGLEKGRGFNKGKTFPLLQGDKSPHWKGINATYGSKHDWIQKLMGKANHCSFDPDHKVTRYHWANISGSYLRDTNDYASLCVKCHKEYDLIRSGRVYR